MFTREKFRNMVACEFLCNISMLDNMCRPWLKYHSMLSMNRQHGLGKRGCQWVGQSFFRCGHLKKLSQCCLRSEMTHEWKTDWISWTLSVLLRVTSQFFFTVWKNYCQIHIETKSKTVRPSQQPGKIKVQNKRQISTPALARQITQLKY